MKTITVEFNQAEVQAIGEAFNYAWQNGAIKNPTLAVGVIGATNKLQSAWDIIAAENTNGKEAEVIIDR